MDDLLQRKLLKEDVLSASLLSQAETNGTDTNALVEKLDKVLVRLTTKRQSYPPDIKSHVAEKYSSLLDELVQSKFDVKSKKEVQDGPALTELCPLLFTRENEITKSFDTLSVLAKSFPQTTNRAERLEKSYRMYATFSACPSARRSSLTNNGHNLVSSNITPVRGKTPHWTSVSGESDNIGTALSKTCSLRSDYTEVISSQRRSLQVNPNS